MSDKMKAEFDAAFVKKFGFGRMMASANADAHQMLNAAEWAWETAAAPAPPQPIYDEAKERELFQNSKPGAFLERRDNGEYWNEFYQAEWKGWLACAQSRAKAGEDV